MYHLLPARRFRSNCSCTVRFAACCCCDDARFFPDATCRASTFHVSTELTGYRVASVHHGHSRQ